MNASIFDLAARRSTGHKGGIYSVCSAHPLVIEAAMRQVLDDGTSLLVEATSNQVDQFGGYTGMRPADFIRFVHEIGERVGLDPARIVFGGDHLGPNPWRERPANEAMALAKELLAAYAAAGFAKLHLDASMRCADDPAVLDDRIVAERAAALCGAAATAAFGTRPVYVIGTEVPVPGGATEALVGVGVTSPDAARRTLDQQPEALAVLVRDGFAILKVGPGLTFALREALYALAAVEAELVDADEQSRLPEVVERVMLERPGNWERYYHGNARQQRLLRVYSYSDRMRYYWNDPSIEAATRKLMDNLAAVDIPENVVSQHLPDQYRAVPQGRLPLEPTALVLDRVRDALRPYATACRA